VRFVHASSRRGREVPPRGDDVGDPAVPRFQYKRFRYRKWSGVAALAGALVMIGSAASASTGWSVVTVPPTGNNTILTGASALTSTNAWAVGEQFGAAGQAPPPPVSYHWNGTAWSLVATPTLGVSSSLLSVSASTATDAWAVGMSVLGRHDDGTLMEHWNGSAWSVNSSLVVTGYTAELTGVVDLSPTNAWAVGEANGSLLEHWNGSTWSEATIPDPDFTPGTDDSISASSASDIWVVGSTLNTATDEFVPEALHFNGTAWSVVPMPQAGTNTSTIGAVTDISPTNAWAVGDDIGATSAVGGSTLIEHWNGSSWSIVPSPTPGADPGLTGIAARGPSDVYAVGSNLPSINGGTVQGMILRWNGSTWSVDTDPTAGSYSPLLAAAAVPGAANEWAVGTLSNSSLILSHG
jgi:hypothetical protein